MPGINLQDYVPVAERVNQAKADIRSIHADQPVMLTDTMGYIRITVVLQDDRSATGTASFRLDLQGRSAQATNPIEDCETSAIGRALALLGYSSSKSIASREEVQEAQRRSDAPASYQQPATNGHSNKITDKQRAMLFAIWKKNEYEGTLEAWIETNYKTRVSELTTKQASEAIEALQPQEA